MALRINTNVAALNAQKNMIATDNMLSASLERLSTGLRINKAADDASGMFIADSLKAQHLGIGQAIRNANDGISIVQTADGALQESINIINTIKTKAIQAASDGQTTVTRTAIQNDINKLMEELSVIAKTTSYNGQKLLSGAFTNKQIQIGAFANETAAISIGSGEATKIGHITQSNLSLSSESGGEVQLTVTSSITGEVLSLNKIDIQSNNSATNGMGALADEVNRYASLTGIAASAIITASTEKAIDAGTTGSAFAINGINIGAITVKANDSDGALLSAINGKTAEHGITAAINSNGTMTITSSDGRAILVSGSISDVFGNSSSQMSTQGYLALTQKGVSQFQINGIGAGAVGEDIVLSADMTTTNDSVIGSGSTIKTGSKFAAGSTLGGDALVESSIATTTGDFELKAGSSLYSFTEIAKGTVLGGSVTIAGNTNSAATATLEQDMLTATGSTLQDGTVIGKDTVVTTAFTSTGTGSVVNYSIGDTLSAAVTLTQDVTLSANMTLKYSSTAAENSIIKAGSILASGTQAGAKLEIGATFDDSATNAVIAAATATTSDILLTEILTGNSDGNDVIKAGSLLKTGTILMLASGSAAVIATTWNGATLVTGSGTLEFGDSINRGQLYTLSGDQVISEDLVIGQASAATDTVTIADGSYLKAGTYVADSGALGTGSSGETVTMTTATLANDMTLQNGSELSAGSKLISGTVIGDNTYVMGGSLDSAATDITTYARTELKANSVIESGSTLNVGSTIGGAITLALDETLDNDMTVTTGTILHHGTKIEQGTILNQDMLLANSADSTGTAYNLSAGDILTEDLYVTTQGGSATVTLSADMTMLKDTVLASGSILAINTANAGTVGLSDTQSYRLADLSVLTQEGAQRAIGIAEAALTDLDKSRSGLGSTQNQLISTISNLSVTKTNIQASESAIRDVDFAQEASNFSKLQLLSQTGSYALAQANAASQNILSLLQ